MIAALWRWAPLAPALIVAAALRFTSLTDRGLIYWDEAKFALEGMRVEAALQALVGAHYSLAAGKAVGTAKPTHALLIAVAYSIVGIHDYAPLLVNALCSVVSVGLLYVIARRLFDPVVAAVAALFLAVSEYDVVYARSALSESDATMLFLAAVAVWIRSCPPVAVDPPVAEGFSPLPGNHLTSGKAPYAPAPPSVQSAPPVQNTDLLTQAPFAPSTSPPTPKYLIPSAFLPGVLVGAAFTTNYRVIIYAATLIALDLLLRLRREGAASLPRATALWLLGAALVPCVWQLIDLLTHARGLTLFRNELTGAWTPYLQEAWYQLREGKQSVIRFEPLPYLDWFVLRQGWPVSLLTAAGFILAAVQRRTAWLIPAALGAVPWLIFIFAPFFVPRNLVPALPFTSVLAAAGLVQIVRALTAAGRQQPLLRQTGISIRTGGRPRPPSAAAARPASSTSEAELQGHNPVRGRALRPQHPPAQNRQRWLSHILTTVIILPLLVLGGWMSWRLTGVRSGFALATNYLQREHARAITTTEIMVFYFPGNTRCEAPALPVSVAQLPAYAHAGYRFAVIERHHGSAVADYIQSHAPLAARYPAVGNLDLGENLIASENSKTPQQDSRPEFVNVYRIDVLRLHGKGTALPCDRERVT